MIDLSGLTSRDLEQIAVNPHATNDTRVAAQRELSARRVAEAAALDRLPTEQFIAITGLDA